MVANEIKNLRTAKHLSQEQLAERAQVSVRTIQRLEAGNDGSIESLNLIAGALGVSVRDLFPGPAGEEQNERIEGAEEQLAAQLQDRRSEYHSLKTIMVGAWVGLMLVWGVCFNLTSGIWDSIMGVFWVVAWMIMMPLLKLLLNGPISRRLDRKYPLTRNRADRNRDKQ